LNFFPSTFFLILAATGGRAIGLFGLVSILISGYQGFSYDLLSVRRFYREEDLAAEDGSGDGLHDSG